MKLLALAFSISVMVLLCAQAVAAPVRIGIIVEGDTAAAASDVLTAELSNRDGLQLLERGQIEKVYHEQGFSAGNKDYLKLGQLLGADGLLLLQRTSEGTNQFLSVRLVAVKPGVIIGSVRSTWPIDNLEQWSKWVGDHFSPLFPKLGVLTKDAIPISVVNLRSSVRSREAEDLERQLTVLTIERLTREREMFVLERRRLDALSAEKELKDMQENEFWNGSYLLEGIIDRDGYSRETMTISARLIPPKGGNPMTIEISTPRKDLSAGIEQLTAKVKESLKLKTESAAWSPEEEASKYYEEAKWALKWGLHKQAQTASESAWALGKHDMDCAIVRTRSYVVDGWIQDLQRQYPRELVFNRYGNKVEFIVGNKPPEVSEVDDAFRVLRLYYEFSRTLPPDEPKARSPWCLLGLEAIGASSLVLQHFYLSPEQQAAAGQKLSDLRALTRNVAVWIADSPTVKAIPVKGDQIHHSDANRRSGSEYQQNIFTIKAAYGVFWQDQPEACIAIYRELLNGPAFSFAHKDLWDVSILRPRVVLWDRADKNHASVLWNSFLQELTASTNFATRIEGKFLSTLQETNYSGFERRFREALAAIEADEVKLDSVGQELLEERWDTDALLREAESKLSFTNRDDLAGFNRNFWLRMEADKKIRKEVSRFEKQKEYLINNTPYNFSQFTETFRSTKYTKEQAAELLPLIEAYRTNMMARGGMKQTTVHSMLAFIGAAEKRIKSVLEPSPSPSPLALETTPPPATTNRAPVIAAKPPDDGPSGILRVDRFSTHRADLMRNVPSTYGLNRSQRFFVGGHLYEAGAEGIFEIVDSGHSKRVLASTRRRPASSVLDSFESLGTPILFPGPNATLRAFVNSKVYSWEGSDWKEHFTFETVTPPEIFKTGILLRSHSRMNSIDIWTLRNDQTNAELCVSDSIPNPAGFSRQASLVGRPRPKWTAPKGISFSSALAVLSESNLLFYVDQTWNPVVGKQSLEKAGRHADLVCFDEQLPGPVIIPLIFDVSKGYLPETKHFGSKLSQPWLALLDDFLVVGHEDASGIWLIPRSDIENRLALERAHHQKEMAPVYALREQITERYDKNKNGLLDPEEKEEAISDPDYMNAYIVDLDINQNNQLEPDELMFFDVNQDKKLDIAEQKAIRSAQWLLAERLFSQVDTDKDGQINRQESGRFEEQNRNIQEQPYLGNQFFEFDTDRDGKIDVGDWKWYQYRLMLSRLRQTVAPGFTPTMPADLMSLETFIDAAWNGRTITNLSSQVRQKPQNAPVPQRP